MRYDSRHIRGFTIFEMLIVLAIVTICMGSVALGSISDYERSVSLGDLDLVRTTLLRARADAMEGDCTSATTSCDEFADYGVYMNGDSMTLYQGMSFAERIRSEDQVVTLSKRESTSLQRGIPNVQEVLFSARSGVVPAPTTLVIPQSTGISKTVVINAEGAIDGF